MKLKHAIEESTSTNGGGYKVQRRRKGKKRRSIDKPYGHQDQRCHRCGTWGHWSRICREFLHTIDVHYAKQKKKKSKVHRSSKKGPLGAIAIPNITPPPATGDDGWVIIDINDGGYFASSESSEFST
ncbi:hypothetical protein E2562_024881 [Oryza meyeriana var. granulata]|uniref:CCHC-type domain-containing protein n=1 Tax=Oryza meyeriana var. granulata TaxID=110450 RepID=A0A6G1DQ33_9ORYZ|nr:hypothetical protein E2562_024881 [Oryza meyeriana var. granulata]